MAPSWTGPGLLTLIVTSTMYSFTWENVNVNQGQLTYTVFNGHALLGLAGFVKAKQQ